MTLMETLMALLVTGCMLAVLVPMYGALSVRQTRLEELREKLIAERFQQIEINGKQSVSSVEGYFYDSEF